MRPASPCAGDIIDIGHTIGPNGELVCVIGFMFAEFRGPGPRADLRIPSSPAPLPTHPEHHSTHQDSHASKDRPRPRVAPGDLRMVLMRGARFADVALVACLRPSIRVSRAIPVSTWRGG